jgi:hypothetical protein
MVAAREDQTEAIARIGFGGLGLGFFLAMLFEAWTPDLTNTSHSLPHYT